MMTMRTSPTRFFASVVLAVAVLLTAAEFGPCAVLGEGMSVSVHTQAPEFTGISAWLNSPPLKMADLKGKVVLVQFWTYTCINCLRTLPYVTKWHEKYKDKGFIVIGVHTPEFAFERQKSNVETAIKRFGITYAVAQDNQFGTWRAYQNQYWPAEYLIDKSGMIVATQFGEGNYQQMENTIARLVGERLPDAKADDPDLSTIGSPEMYFGTEKNNDAIVSSQSSGAGERSYTAPNGVALDRFALSGTWKLNADNATLSADGGEILLRFRSPKVNLVAGSVSSQTLSITVDGKPQPPVTVRGSELYPLYSGASGEHVLRLAIPKAGLSAFTFTFG
jgi:thiol-disulfide isomerase/thioredoxin